MRRFAQVLMTAVILGTPLAGCGSFDPTSALDFLDNEKPLPGERKPVFPDGTPGVSKGVPSELVKGNTPSPDASFEAAVAETPPAETKVEPVRRASTEAAKPRPRRQAARPAPQQPAADETPQPAQQPAQATQWPEPPRQQPQQQQQQATQWPEPPRPAAQPQQSTQWPDPPRPAAQQQQSAPVAWPAAPAPGSFSR